MQSIAEILEDLEQTSDLQQLDEVLTKLRGLFSRKKKGKDASTAKIVLRLFKLLYSYDARPGVKKVFTNPNYHTKAKAKHIVRLAKGWLAQLHELELDIYPEDLKKIKADIATLSESFNRDGQPLDEVRDLPALGYPADAPKSLRKSLRKSKDDTNRLLAGGVSNATLKRVNEFADSIGDLYATLSKLDLPATVKKKLSKVNDLLSRRYKIGTKSEIRNFRVRDDKYEYGYRTVGRKVDVPLPRKGRRVGSLTLREAERLVDGAWTALNKSESYASTNYGGEVIPLVIPVALMLGLGAIIGYVGPNPMSPAILDPLLGTMSAAFGLGLGKAAHKTRRDSIKKIKQQHKDINKATTALAAAVDADKKLLRGWGYKV